MTRITNDLLSVSELFHHGPEDLAIALLKFLGAFIMLISINSAVSGASAWRISCSWANSTWLA
jgi:ATP-binding cassette subfamily B protein